MTDETPFLTAIATNPRSEFARLVYADWLEEQSDVRAEYIRNQCELIKADYGGVRHAELLARQRNLRTRIARDWIARLDYHYWPTELTAKNFEEEVIRRRGIIAVHFYGRQLEPYYPAEGIAVLEELASELAGLVFFGMVNAEKEPQLVSRYSAHVGTGIFFMWGRILERRGLSDKDYAAHLAISLYKKPLGGMNPNRAWERWGRIILPAVTDMPPPAWRPSTTDDANPDD